MKKRLCPEWLFDRVVKSPVYTSTNLGLVGCALDHGIRQGLTNNILPKSSSNLPVALRLLFLQLSFNLPHGCPGIACIGLVLERDPNLRHILFNV